MNTTHHPQAESVCSQYTRYLRFCKKHGVAPQGFAHFVVDVFPFTLF